MTAETQPPKTLLVMQMQGVKLSRIKRIAKTMHARIPMTVNSWKNDFKTVIK